MLSTIIKGKPWTDITKPNPGWWEPKLDPKTGYYGERGQAALWPTPSACNGKDDEAEEADKKALAIRKILAENGKPVAAGQNLFLVDPVA